MHPYTYHFGILIEFVVSPQNQTTAVRVKAVFKCQHTTAAIIWRTNGKSVVGNITHIPESVPDGETFIYTMTIMAKPEFNNTVVECEVVDHNERRYAKLSVQG